MSLSSKARRLSHTEDFKPIILRELMTLRNDEISNRNSFKVQAYNRVIQGIQALTPPIRSFEDLQDVKGIGPRIKAKLIHIFKEGKLSRAQELQQQPRTAVLDLFQSIYGIGPVKAKELYKQGFRTLDDLKTRGYEYLNPVQQKGLLYHSDFQQRIPRNEMIQHDHLIQQAASKMGVKAEVVGSYRRGALSSGDIDVLVTYSTKVKHPSRRFESFLTQLKEEGYLVDSLAEGQTKWLGVASLHPSSNKIDPHTPPYRRIDFLFTPPQEYPYALVHFTGSDQFNIRLSHLALEQGYSLSKNGIKPLRTHLPLLSFQTEKEIVQYFFGKYIPPEERVVA